MTEIFGTFMLNFMSLCSKYLFNYGLPHCKTGSLHPLNSEISKAKKVLLLSKFKTFFVVKAAQILESMGSQSHILLLFKWP